ncbi:MAG TPA: tryptophan synthase subunit alpha [Dehalococcoidia bacterium]
MSRLEETFRALREAGRTGLVAYLTAGYPSVEETLRLVPALVEGGADVVELGVPFSDPLADGATIQRANFRALQQGVTPGTCLELVAELRRRGLTAPLLLMGYYNPVVAWGEGAFVEAAARAGADGLILVDLPPEEADGLRAACRAAGLDLVFLLAPTSTDERIARVAAQASGFIYCVSVTGVTGARSQLPPGLAEFVGRVRRRTDLPLAVGFGISTREHVEAVGRLADAAIIGSAIIDVVDRAGPSGAGRAGPDAAAQVRAYLETVTGRRRA